jgi:hypothetical protein
MTNTMQTLTIPAAQIAKVRRGDKIIAIDGRRARYTYTVTAGLAQVGVGTAQGIAMQLPDGRTANLYPDTHVSESVTIERATKATAGDRVEAADRKNATHINIGDELIVEQAPDGLRATRRKTGVIVVKVTGKRKHGYRGYLLTTTGGDIDTPAAGMFGIAGK